MGHEPEVETGGAVFRGDAVEAVAIEGCSGVVVFLVGPSGVREGDRFLARELRVDTTEGRRVLTLFFFPESGFDQPAVGSDATADEASHLGVLCFEILAACLGVVADGGFGVDGSDQDGEEGVLFDADDLLGVDLFPIDGLPGAHLGIVELLGEILEAIAEVL